MRGRDGPMCRKTSLDIPSLNGYVKHEESPPEPEKKSTCRRLSLADAISDSFRTLAMTARRNSSPLSRRLTRKMKRSRMVLKNGMCNVNNTNVPKKDRQYLRDFFTTMIDVKWRWLFMTFTLVFLASWSTFAIVYFLLSYMHGDMDLASNNSSNASAVWEPCVAEVTSLYSAFLYSVETQHTIGYGTRHITTACPAAGMTLCLQCICGLLIQSFMVGLVFAKMARPKKRAETLIFSRHAVVALRDGQLCLLFRVGDMRNTHLVEAHVRLQLITDRETEEGE
uniref:Uncharacterized protein n=1 Tax=Plectus sambesii TaxID=2011161 RepID=A0A914UXD9_9BILA